MQNKLGFDKIFESVNLSAQALYHDYKKMQARLNISKDYDEKTFVWVYYNGEGGLDSRGLDTYAVIQGKSYFALEHYLRELA